MFFPAIRSARSKKINVGDVVCKRSRKPFKHKKRIAVVIAKTSMYIPCNDKTRGKFVPGVFIKGVEKPITISMIHTNKDEIIRCRLRDSGKGGYDTDDGLIPTDTDSYKAGIWKDFYPPFKS